MKIILAEHFGACFGVRDAYQLALELADQGSLTILGELAHNPIINQRLKAAGVKSGELDAVGSAETKRVLITAHGASDQAREAWSQAGYEVSDATCPLVKHAHTQLRKLVEAGYFPIVIGRKGHVEVNGLTGDFPESAVVLEESDFATLPDRPRFGVIAQTTQPIIRVQALVAALRRHLPNSEVRFVDTVCRPTKERQTALNNLIDQVDRVVVVGGGNSNNTRQLALACERAGKTAHHVAGPDEVRASWFSPGETVGLTAGTSTLPETVQAVRRRLESIAAALEAEFAVHA